jgi:hypothetical protein
MQLFRASKRERRATPQGSLNRLAHSFFIGSQRFPLDPILIQSYLGTGGIRIKPTGSDENRMSAGAVANPGVEGYMTGLTALVPIV